METRSLSAITCCALFMTALGTARGSEAPGPVIQRRGAVELLAHAVSVGPPGTDVVQPRSMAARFDGRVVLPPEPVQAGVVLDGAVAWVTVSGALIIDDGKSPPRVIAQNALPELAASPSGRLLAFARRPGSGAGVSIWNGHAVSSVTPGLVVADRPLFISETRLVVAGAPASGIAGLWQVDLSMTSGKLRSLTNAGLRVGQPLGATFVPPPADHASMRVEDGWLVYFDGERTQRVALSGERP